MYIELVLNDLTMENEGDFAENSAYLPRPQTELDESFHNNEKSDIFIIMVLSNYLLTLKNKVNYK